MHLGKIIKKYRKANKITMEEFANLSGLSKGYVSMLEKNMNPTTGKEIAPSLEVIKKVADAINMDVNDLIDLLGDNTTVNLETQNIYGDHQANLEYFADKPDLLEMYKEIHENESLTLLFDTARELSPQDLEKVLRYMKLVQDEEL